MKKHPPTFILSVTTTAFVVLALALAVLAPPAQGQTTEADRQRVIGLIGHIDSLLAPAERDLRDHWRQLYDSLVIVEAAASPEMRQRIVTRRVLASNQHQQMTQIRSQSNNLRRLLTELRDDLDVTQIGDTELQLQIVALQNEIGELQDQMANTVEDYESEVTQLLMQQEALQAEIDQLRDAVDPDIADQLERLEFQVDSLAHQHTLSQNTITELNDTIVQLNATIQRLQEELQDPEEQARRIAYLAAHPPDRMLYFWRYDRGEVPADTGLFLSQYVREANQFALVMYVHPRSITETGPSRWLTISASSSLRNFTIGQTGRDIEIRMRTTNQTTNGLPAITLSNVLTDDYLANPDRVLLLYLIYDQGEFQVWINAELRREHLYAGSTANWADYGIMLNDEFGGGRESSAVLRQIEFYTFLDQTDVDAKRHWLEHYVTKSAWVQLSWEVVPNATSYGIEIYTDQAMTDLVISAATNELRYDFYGFKGETYYYRVRGLTGETQGPWSQTGTFTLPE